jgi:hypothetical protein
VGSGIDSHIVKEATFWAVSDNLASEHSTEPTVISGAHDLRPWTNLGCCSGLRIEAGNNSGKNARTEAGTETVSDTDPGTAVVGFVQTAILILEMTIALTLSELPKQHFFLNYETWK